MIKKALIGIMILNIVIGCGGGGDNFSSTPNASISPSNNLGNQIRNRDAIFIFYNTPKSICESQDYLRELKRGNHVKDVLVQVQSNNITCSDYGKNRSNCLPYNTGGSSPYSCVEGVNYDPTNNLYNKLEAENFPILAEDIMERAIIAVEE